MLDVGLDDPRISYNVVGKEDNSLTLFQNLPAFSSSQVSAEEMARVWVLIMFIQPTVRP